MFLFLGFVIALVLKDGAHVGYWMLGGSILDGTKHRKSLTIAVLEIRRRIFNKRLS